MMFQMVAASCGNRALNVDVGIIDCFSAKIGKIGERGKDYFPIVSFTLDSRAGISRCCGHFAKHSPQATHEDAGSPRCTGDIETV